MASFLIWQAPSYGRYVMASNEYSLFLRDCRITDEESSHAKSHNLDTIFIAANVEEKANSNEEKLVNEVDTYLELTWNLPGTYLKLT